MSADLGYATTILHDQLGWAREAVLRTLEGLDELELDEEARDLFLEGNARRLGLGPR